MAMDYVDSPVTVTVDTNTLDDAPTNTFDCQLIARSAASLAVLCFSRFFCLPLVCAVSVLHILFLLAQVVQSVGKHTLGTRFCHIMFLFWSLIPQQW